MADSFVSGSLELRVPVQLREWYHKVIFIPRTPGAPQQPDGCSANRALTLPSELRVSVSQCINSAVQRRALTAVTVIRKSWYRHPSKTSKAMVREKPGSRTFLQTFCFCSALVTQTLSYFHFREWLALTLLHLSFLFLWLIYSETVFREVHYCLIKCLIL